MNVTPYQAKYPFRPVSQLDFYIYLCPKLLEQTVSYTYIL